VPGVRVLLHVVESAWPRVTLVRPKMSWSTMTPGQGPLPSGIHVAFELVVRCGDRDVGHIVHLTEQRGWSTYRCEALAKP
jgi:hypothetical protein